MERRDGKTAYDKTLMKFSDIIEKLRLKKLDWYIIRKFIATFFMALVLIIVIVIIFDISEKIDDFVQHEVPLKEIVFDYYLNFIPYFMNMFSPMFIFITVIFFTSRMAANTEIVAILSCGISFRRFMRPYMISAAFIAMLSLCLNLWVIPDANKTRMKFETDYVRDYSGAKSMRDAHYQISPGQFVYVESFSKWNNTAYKFTLESIDGHNIVSKISADQAVWDSTFCGWTLKRYTIREFGPDLEDKVRCGDRLDTVINLTIGDFKKTRDYETQLNHRELNEYIAIKRMRGDADVKKALIEKNVRYAMPFSAFILTIIGVALSSRKRRGGTGWNLGLGIALSFSYILFQKFSEMFVYTDTLPAFIAIWLPNVIFTVIAFLLYRIAPK